MTHSLVTPLTAQKRQTIYNRRMSRECKYCVYILSSKSRVLYVGVTGSLMARLLRHKAGEQRGFTQKYRANRLVWYQRFALVGDAIARETEIKKWRREKKVKLIFENNPTWEDLAADWGKPFVLERRETICERQVPRV